MKNLLPFRQDIILIGIALFVLIIIIIFFIYSRKVNKPRLRDPRGLEIINNMRELYNRIKDKEKEIYDFKYRLQEDIEGMRERDRNLNAKIMHFHQEAFVALRNENITGARTFVKNKLLMKKKADCLKELQNLLKKIDALIQQINNHEESLKIQKEEVINISKKKETLTEENPFFMVIETLEIINNDLDALDQKLLEYKEEKNQIIEKSLRVSEDEVEEELIKLENEIG